jgi:hypothetical protein
MLMMRELDQSKGHVSFTKVALLVFFACTFTTVTFVLDQRQEMHLARNVNKSRLADYQLIKANTRNIAKEEALVVRV